MKKLKIVPYQTKRVIIELTNEIIIVKDWVAMLAIEFDSIIHHVKKGKRSACRHKAATVLPNRTAPTLKIYSSLSSFEFDIV